MRKIYLFLAATALSTVGFAQQLNEGTLNYQKAKFEALKAKPTTSEVKTSSRGDITSQWISFADALDGQTTPVFATTTLWPDSTIKYVGTDGTDGFYNNLLYFAHGIMQTYDPASPAWGEGYDEASFAAGASHTLDSLQLNFLYDRQTDSTVVDTMRVFLIRTDDAAQGIYLTTSGSSGSSPFAYIPYDSSELGPGSIYVDRVIDFPLTEADSTGEFYSTKIVDLDGIEINGDEKFSYAVTYIPGTSYNFGDTLVSFDDTKTITNAHNWFAIRTFEEEEGEEMYSLDAAGDDMTYNYASLAFTDTRYMDTATADGGFWGYEYYQPSHWYSASFPIEQVHAQYYVTIKAADFTAQKECLSVTLLDESNFDVASTKFLVGENDDQGTELEKIGINKIATHTYQAPGTYTVTVESKENGTNKKYTYSKNVTVDFCPGIDGIEANDALSVYPNPATNNVNIELNLDNVEDITVEVVDVFGKVVFADAITANQYRHNLNVEGLASGMYKVSVTAGSTKSTKNVFVGK